MLDIPSPCVGICRLDPTTGLCLGCMRSADEIAAWPRASYVQRLQIVERLRARRRAVGRTSAADSRPRRRRQATEEQSWTPSMPAIGRAMPPTLLDLLATKAVALADGAMGTSLFAQGLATGDSPELWNLVHPERVRVVHRGFIESGSDLILTNSFGANRCRLTLHGAAERVGELNRAAAALARAEADRAGRTVLVAGSIGPTGEIFQPIGALAPEDGAAAFAEQAAALAEGGCDLLWIETLSAAEELQAAVAGAARTGLPIVATMTFDTHGRTMMGLTPAAAMALRAGLAARPAAFGANCGIGPAQLVESVLGLSRAAAPDDIIVAKGNCGIPQYHDGHIHYDGTPAVMADYACLARDAGARVIGGCCGTTPAHLVAMAEALATRPASPPPDRAAIEARLGPLPTPPETGEPGRERRRRRSA